MSRRSLFMTLGTLCLVCTGLAGLLYYLVRYERAWYVQAGVPAGETRTRHSQDFKAEFWEFINSIGSEPQWWGEFKQEQINSFFEEEFVQSGLGQRILPEGIEQPRLSLDTENLRFGFRYGSGPWSALITVELRVWLPAGEPNVLALELVGLHAGILPIKAHSILERIAQSARDNGIEVNWYRHNNHPVALLRFQADQPRVTMQLQSVSLGGGAIMIRGCYPEGTPARASVPPTVAGAKTATN